MTFSLVLAVPRAGLIAVGTASRSLGVGNSVPALWPGVGAVVSQAWTNRSLRGRVLSGLADGATPDAVVARIPGQDPDHRLRQLAAVDTRGRTAAHTGAGCSAWAGSAPVHGESTSGMVCANFVAGPGVLAAMTSVVDTATPPEDPEALARLVLASLQAGQAAGGDSRGQQSAALLVGEGRRQSWQPPDLTVDLRVDDHDVPLAELGRLLRLRRP